jgi:uncharacterized protein YhaN
MYIADFGIIRNQTLDNISNGLVVIGGLNRAGKSTFMEILRHIAWGFPKNMAIPFTGDKYDVSCDLQTDEDLVYNIRLAGYAEPSVNVIPGAGSIFTGDVPGSASSAQDIFVIDKFTYQQLFTINLGLLRKVPEDMTDKESRKLYSVLLGAGIEEIAHIPDIEKDFLKEAEKIGGKHGNPKFKNFSPYYQRIEEGIKLKKQALAQVGSYMEAMKQLEETQKEIEALEKDISHAKSKALLLDILVSGYDDYIKKNELEEEIGRHEGKQWAGTYPLNSLARAQLLKESFQNTIDDRNKLTTVFNASIRKGDTTFYLSKLLEYEEELTELQRSISGLSVRIENYAESCRESERLKDEILIKMKKADPAWDETHVDFVGKIPAGDMEASKLNEDCELVDKYKEKLASANEQLQRLEEQKSVEKKRFDSYQKDLSMPDIKKTAGILALMILSGVLLFLINPFLITLPALSILILGIMLLSRTNRAKSLHEYIRQSETVLSGYEADIGSLSSDIEKYEIGISEISSRLSAYAASLGIEGSLSLNILESSLSPNLPGSGLSMNMPGDGFSPNMLKERLKVVQSIQEKILSLQRLEKTIGNSNKDILTELEKYSNVLEGLQDSPDEDPGNLDLAAYSEKLFSRVEYWNENLKKAKDINIVQAKLEGLKKVISTLLGNTRTEVEEGSETDEVTILEDLDAFIERCGKAREYLEIKNALDNLISKIINPFSIGKNYGALCHVMGEKPTDEELLKYLSAVYQEYLFKSEIEDEYRKQEAELEKMQEEHERLKEHRMNLEKDLVGLKETTNLEKAQKQIDEARKALKQIAVKYSSYKAAAYVLNLVQNEYVERMKDTVLSKAGNIFSQITNNEYETLSLPSLSEPEFKAVLKGGAEQQSVDMLSRGTCEQLYMAVRISRILETTPRLPVVIDDSLVNFDIIHVRQLLQVLKQLSQSHQVFMLTCHPELVMETGSHDLNAQYWELDKGKFSISDCQKLTEHLLRINDQLKD